MKPLLLFFLLMLCVLTCSFAQTSHAIDAQPIMHLPDSVIALQRNVIPSRLQPISQQIRCVLKVVCCEQHIPPDIFRMNYDAETLYRILRLTGYASCEDGSFIFGDQTLWRK